MFTFPKSAFWCLTVCFSVSLLHAKESDRFLVPKNPQALISYKLDLKILLLTATDSVVADPSFHLAKKALQNLGINFEVWALTKNGVRVNSGELQLTNPDGSGKFYGIITSTRDLGYQRPDLNWESALTPAQWAELKKFELTYSIRRVAMTSVPTAEMGLRETPARLSENTLKLSKNSLPYAYGIQSNTQPKLDKVWHYETKIENDALARAFLSYKNSKVAAAEIKYPDGREELHFFFEQSPLSLASIVISPLWIKWLTRNIHVGKRRMYLNIQVDDLFLDTALWDTGTQTTPPDGTEGFRISAEDLSAFTEFQNNTLRPILGNQTYRTEMAYNGIGIIENGDYQEDLLFLKSHELAKDFYWVSHTWDHLDLDLASFQDTRQELLLNFQTAQYLEVWGTSIFSANSMVTPKISGLFNPEAMRALAEQGINYVVGDDSRPELVNIYNQHLGIYTHSNIYIIPRNATDIFYDTSLPQELVSKFNVIYSAVLKKHFTLDDIYNQEEARALPELLSFDSAPWMFHQANLKKFKFNKNEESLLSLWLKKITTGIRKYSTLPILNVKMNDLKNLYMDREKFEKCNFHGQIEVQNFHVIRITATSLNSCKVAISGIFGKGIGVSQEMYGPDKNIVISLDGKNVRAVNVEPMVPLF